jgi:hypothetical protein
MAFDNAGWSKRSGVCQHIRPVQDDCEYSDFHLMRLRSYISISEGYGYCTPLQIFVYLLTASGRAESPNVASWQKDFAKQGYSTLNKTVARRQFSATVTPEDVQKFSDWDTSFVWEKFPQETDVLTIHGLSDELVPP